MVGDASGWAGQRPAGVLGRCCWCWVKAGKVGSLSQREQGRIWDILQDRALRSWRATAAMCEGPRPSRLLSEHQTTALTRPCTAQTLQQLRRRARRPPMHPHHSSRPTPGTQAGGCILLHPAHSIPSPVAPTSTCTCLVTTSSKTTVDSKLYDSLTPTPPAARSRRR